jgi:hypothetical protein
MMCAGCEKRRKVTAARPYLEDPLALVHGERLQYACFELGQHHALAFGRIFVERNFEIRESETPVRLGNEFLAAHDVQEVEHILIEHFPRADLLLDHVEAGLLDVHGEECSEKTRKF